ncbi:MAG: serine hydrolase domain-containing protein [Hyphomonadaceae bacterium]|nr:serine hydrolase domain-containing protein [Hyphomonadaceae bacterium]
MHIKTILLSGLSAAALSGCMVSVTDTQRPPALHAATMAPPMAHGPIHNDTTASQTLTRNGLTTLDAVMKQYITDGKLGGAVIKINQHGREVFSEAYGWRDREANVPMQEDTIFRIASQTKALTSVSIMMLMEEGKLVLEDPVGKFLPEWQKTTVAVAKEKGGYEVVPAKRPITIRDLLSHTAGVSYGTGPAEKAWRDAGIFGWYFADKSVPVSDVVAKMAKLPMAAQPGEQWVYGYNTDILGVVVEKLSGKSLDVFFKERLIDPLGMADTAFCLPPEKTNRLAVVYTAVDGKAERAANPGKWEGSGHIGQGHYAGGPCKAFAGGAGLLSTANDYSRFLEMLRQGGTFEGKRYISRNSVDLMSHDTLVSAPYQAGQGFGLGFRVTMEPSKMGNLGSVGDYGWGGAYHSTYWVDPKEDLTIVYMTQLIPAGGLEEQAKIRALIYSALD